MVYFLNTEVQDEKNLLITLSSVYGIGRKSALKICKKLGFNPRSTFSELNNSARQDLTNFVEFRYLHGFHLKRKKTQDIKSLIDLKCYRGNRHRAGYLVRGQRSKNKKIRKHR